MSALDRRDFLKGSIGAAATFTVLPGGKSIAAGNKIILGIMGVGGRGRALLGSLVKRSDVYIKYICDADTRRYGPAAEIVMEDHDYKPKFVQDFRKMLEDKEVDAVVVATSDRWHALATIMACQAGKDVYVEKPQSMSIWDGRKMIEAARKYKRVVQVGMQTRSAPYVDKAIEYIRSGKLGEVKLARVYLMQQGWAYQLPPVQPVPEGPGHASAELRRIREEDVVVVDLGCLDPLDVFYAVPDGIVGLNLRIHSIGRVEVLEALVVDDDVVVGSYRRRDDIGGIDTGLPDPPVNSGGRGVPFDPLSDGGVHRHGYHPLLLVAGALFGVASPEPCERLRIPRALRYPLGAVPVPGFHLNSARRKRLSRIVGVQEERQAHRHNNQIFHSPPPLQEPPFPSGTLQC